MVSRAITVVKIAWCIAAMSRPPRSGCKRSAATLGKTSNSISGQNRNRPETGAILLCSTASVAETGTQLANVRSWLRKHLKIDDFRLDIAKIHIVKSSTNVIALRSAIPDVAEVYSAADEEISRAISRAQENLLRQQRPDGHWCGELIVDSTLCSDFVLFMHWLSEVNATLQERCVRHILKRQLPDGGWNIYYGGPSEINASVKGYFALKLAGYSPDLPFMRKARETILRLGGIPRMNTFSKLYLALLGQFPWRYLPTFPSEMILLPKVAPFHTHNMSSLSRAMLIPLAIINHFKPTRSLPGDSNCTSSIRSAP